MKFWHTVTVSSECLVAFIVSDVQSVMCPSNELRRMHGTSGGVMHQVVPEPVDKWQNIQDTNGGQPSNLLEAFYKNPERYAYTFQNYVFVTRLMQVRTD